MGAAKVILNEVYLFFLLKFILLYQQLCFFFVFVLSECFKQQFTGRYVGFDTVLVDIRMKLFLRRWGDDNIIIIFF